MLALGRLEHHNATPDTSHQDATNVPVTDTMQSTASDTHTHKVTVLKSPVESVVGTDVTNAS